MNVFSTLVSGPTGLLHLLAATVALVTGMWVLVSTKGTSLHRKIGYVYALSMLLTNGTAFLIYTLYGRFAIFHWFAVLSLLTLAGGMYPLRRKAPGYLLRHFNFMYWSVLGLYCAFVAEVFTRLPKYVLTESGEPMTIFYQMVGVGTFVVMAVGGIAFARFKPLWTKQFGER